MTDLAWTCRCSCQHGAAAFMTLYQLLFAVSQRVDCSSSQHDSRQKHESLSQQSLHLVTERSGRNTAQQPWWRACQMTNQHNQNTAKTHTVRSADRAVSICNAGRACCITVLLESTQVTSDFSEFSLSRLAAIHLSTLVRQSSNWLWLTAAVVPFGLQWTYSWVSSAYICILTPKSSAMSVGSAVRLIQDKAGGTDPCGTEHASCTTSDMAERYTAE